MPVSGGCGDGPDDGSGRRALAQHGGKVGTGGFLRGRFARPGVRRACFTPTAGMGQPPIIAIYIIAEGTSRARLQQEALPIPPMRPDSARHRHDNRLSSVPTEMKRTIQPKGRESRPVGPCSACGESVPTLTGSFVSGLLTTGVSLPGLKYSWLLLSSRPRGYGLGSTGRQPVRSGICRRGAD